MSVAGRMWKTSVGLTSLSLFSSFALGSSGGLECQALFADRMEQYRIQKSAAETEFSSALDRWRLAPPSDMQPHKSTKPTTALAPFSLKPSGAHLHYSRNSAILDSIRDEMEFYKRGAFGTPMDSPERPAQYSIAQTLVTRDSIVVLRPNISEGIRSAYGTGPIRAHLSTEGEFQYISGLFQNPQHPLNNIDPAFKHYHLSLNVHTSLIRAVMTSNEKAVPRAGSADVFFTDAQGREYPSLSESTNQRFSNVVALSDTMYVVELSQPPADQPGIGFVFLEYEPLSRPVRILMTLPGETNSRLRGILRQQKNRDVATGFVDDNGNVTMALQTHLIMLDFKKRNGMISPLPFRNPISDLYDSASPMMTHFDQSVRVIETQTTVAPEPYLLQLSTVLNPMQPPRNLLTRRPLTEMGHNTTWELGNLRLNPVLHRVKGGFVGQQDDPLLPHARMIYFFADEGGVPHPLFNSAIENLGAFSIIDGHLFVVGPAGELLMIQDMPQWR